MKLTACLWPEASRRASSSPPSARTGKTACPIAPWRALVHRLHCARSVPDSREIRRAGTAACRVRSVTTQDRAAIAAWLVVIESRLHIVRLQFEGSGAAKLEQSPRRTPPGLGAHAAALSTEVEPINNKRAERAAVKAKARPRGRTSSTDGRALLHPAAAYRRFPYAPRTKIGKQAFYN